MRTRRIGLACAALWLWAGVGVGADRAPKEKRPPLRSMITSKARGGIVSVQADRTAFAVGVDAIYGHPIGPYFVMGMGVAPMYFYEKVVVDPPFSETEVTFTHGTTVVSHISQTYVTDQSLLLQSGVHLKGRLPVCPGCGNVADIYLAGLIGPVWRNGDWLPGLGSEITAGLEIFGTRGLAVVVEGGWGGHVFFHHAWAPMWLVSLGLAYLF